MYSVLIKLDNTQYISLGQKNIHEKSIQIKNYIKYIITAENI